MSFVLLCLKVRAGPFCFYFPCWCDHAGCSDPQGWFVLSVSHQKVSTELERM
uniref:Uncharacterized protein n=1 Tax=Anguilla anguilla TaxID=7936 RepID=A0A0E9XR16_ANGAN